MARRVGLPSPTLTPFGGGARSFSQYDVLDDGSRDDGREFQKQQALWAAGKITDGAYLAAYQKYVNGLEKGSSQRINAQQSLDRERYTMGRNDIVARIDAGDESAWGALLAYDQQSLSGMQGDNEEYQRRLNYMRQTQNAIFQNRYADMSAKVQAGKMTNQQLYSWLRSQQRGGLTSNNGALAQQIDSAADAMSLTIANEKREKVYARYQDGKMSPSEFINYARTQRNGFRKGTVQHAQWAGRVQAAKLARQDSRVSYRWKLSQQYHENQKRLETPDPSAGKTAKTRRIYSDGQWREETLDYTPTAREVEQYESWQQEQELLRGEQARIERELGRAGVDFIDPGQMIKFYRRRQKGTIKGTTEWLALQQNINQLRDIKAAWDTFTPENGYESSGGEAPTVSGKGRALPTEGGINAQSFMAALGQQYGGAKQQADMGVSNRYGITDNEWRTYAKEYLGDASAKQTPDNLDLVVEQRLNDLHDRYGSWAMVGYAWTNGGDADTISQWDSGSKQVVDSMWQSMGLGGLPQDWTFNQPKPVGGSRGIDPTILGPAAPGQEYVGAGVPSEPQLFQITGPVGPNGVPRTTKTIGIEGMTPGEFDSVYSVAQKAFVNGETSFSINGINYYFPEDLSTRADMMGDLDTARTDLRYADWQESQGIVNAMGGQATQEQIDKADDMRQKHALAYDQMNQNAIDMLFMKQKAGYTATESADTTLGADTEGTTNYNPGADYQRIEELNEAGIQQHIDAANDWFSKGHPTQALLELQTAEDMARKARVHMEVLDGQVQQATQAVQGADTNVTEEQRTDIEAVAKWEEKWGEEGEIAGSILTQRNEIEPWLAKDEQGNFIWSEDQTNILGAPGTAWVLKHSQDGSNDTVEPAVLKTRPRPGTAFGTVAPEPFLENHLQGQVTIGGDSINVWMPYSNEEVGVVVTDDGRTIPIKSKIIWTNVNGLGQTIIEDPFKPGTFQVQDGNREDQPGGMVWKAPEGFVSEQDDYGNQRISWDANGNTYTMAWNPNNSAYDLFEQSHKKEGGIGPLGGERPDPQYIGNLGDNPTLADELVAPLFARDMSDVPKYAMPAQDMPGAHAGMTAEQFGATQKVEKDLVRREQATQARNAANADRIARGQAGMPIPGTQITDEMRSTSSLLSDPIQRQSEPVAGPSPSPRPTPAPTPIIDGTPINVTNPAVTFPSPSPGPAPSAPPKQPKSTPVAKTPSYTQGPIIL